MTRLCQGALCTFPAEVVVDRSEAPPLEVCWEHLRQILQDLGATVGGFHRIGWQAACCRESCSDDADGIVTDRDDIPHLYCQRHLDELGQLSLPRVVSVDEGGWSGG